LPLLPDPVEPVLDPVEPVVVEAPAVEPPLEDPEDPLPPDDELPHAAIVAAISTAANPPQIRLPFIVPPRV
jgi:hypothetical protein